METNRDIGETRPTGAVEEKVEENASAIRVDEAFDTTQPTQITEVEPVTVTVSVAGAIQHPGVYTLSKDKRVKDAIEEGGGVLSESDLRDINLAAPLIDGTTLVIPYGGLATAADGKLEVRAGQDASLANPPQYTISGWNRARITAAGSLETGAGRISPDSPSELKGPDNTSGLIDINTASATDLEDLPGIGPKLAAQIIEYRNGTPFRSIDDLENVSGIGPKKLEAIRPFVTVRTTP